jgi:pyruvate dehydrogenase E2 component (dihydrolipoamide acetyltransferase)
MGEMVDFRSNGGTCPGYLATPDGGGPGLVVIQEWWGLVPHIIDVADRFADAGFTALAPDLFRGAKATEPESAARAPEVAAAPDDARAEMQMAARSEGKTEPEALPRDQPAQAGVSPKAEPSTEGAAKAEFKLPELGENIEQGDLVRLMIAPGSHVSEGQPVMELETDKAVIEVPSSMSGTVQDVRVKQGDKVKVGQVIFTVAGATQPKAAGPHLVESKQQQEESKPQQGDYISGQQAAQMAFQAAIRADGKTERAALPPDKPVAAPPSFEMPAGLARTAGAEHREPIPAAPHVRRLARELGVDIYQVNGTGPGGRISEEDVKTFTKAAIVSMAEAVSVPSRIAEPVLPDFSKWGKVEHVSMRGVRRKTAEHLAQAWNTIPHVTQHDKADITHLEQLRSRFAARTEQAGGKMTVTAVALKVCASALKVFPVPPLCFRELSLR